MQPRRGFRVGAAAGANAQAAHRAAHDALRDDNANWIARPCAHARGADFTMVARYDVDHHVEVVGGWHPAGREGLVGRRSKLWGIAIVASATDTRRRIERDLHDGGQQRLVSLGLDVRALQAAVPRDQRDVLAGLDRLAAELASTSNELREFARGIHPAILTEAGLLPAL